MYEYDGPSIPCRYIGEGIFIGGSVLSCAINGRDW